LNESATIVDTLQLLTVIRRTGAEIIVVDGGSTDQTVELSSPLADKVVASERGRSNQMNAGAAASSGEVLLFLHADTLLPENAEQYVLAAISAGAEWGRFDVRIREKPLMLRVVSFMMNARSRITGIATGDQAIFVTRESFYAVGGFPKIPLMEDIVFSRQMIKRSRPACLRQIVATSGRRWVKHGVIRTILLMWSFRLRFFFGASPSQLAKEYGYTTKDIETK
jgi:rSAM/selenodomain-associated transferase 2